MTFSSPGRPVPAPSEKVEAQVRTGGHTGERAATSGRTAGARRSRAAVRREDTFAGTYVRRDNRRRLEYFQSPMKAMVLRAPRDLTADEVAPPARGPRDVLVRVTHSGICGTDYKIYSGAIP